MATHPSSLLVVGGGLFVASVDLNAKINKSLFGSIEIQAKIGFTEYIARKYELHGLSTFIADIISLTRMCHGGCNSKPIPVVIPLIMAESTA